MLYQEGWGVGRIKHSLTYSGGLSRSYVRTYAPGAAMASKGSVRTRSPTSIEVAEAIPFAALTQYDVPTLYALKGEIVRRGVKAITGFDMPVFPKRRFQHGAVPVEHAAGIARRRRSRVPPGVPRALLVQSNATLSGRARRPRPLHPRSARTQAAPRSLAPSRRHRRRGAHGRGVTSFAQRPSF